MKIAVLVVSRNRPDLVRNLAGWLKRNMTYDHDLIVVEAGTRADQLTEYSTLHYEDEDFRGKCFAHNVALEHAKQQEQGGTPYDYYWVLMNDLVFEEGTDVARALVEAMELEPRLGILSPTCKDRIYPSSGRQGHTGWRAVTTCDYLGFMMRAEAVKDVGFLNPSFSYCWGAIHELAYKLYRSGWIVAYSDAVEYEHLGGTTYGAQGTNTISREEYQVRAKRFAFEYFLKTYGPQWPSDFWAATAGHDIEVNTFHDHYQMWATAFRPEEVAALIEEAQAPALQASTDMQSSTNMQANQQPTSPLLRLHLGCGPDHREGWVNVDVNPKFSPDIVAPVGELPMLADGSCEVIESFHLFEHLTFTQARAALREWRRLLAPGGELRVELPNLARCVELIGTDMGGYDLGMISLFGYPPEVDEQGEPQLHKWGWTPESLAMELQAAGFENVQQVSIVQTERAAAAFDRDMRLIARVAAPSAGLRNPIDGESSRSAPDSPTAEVAQPALSNQGGVLIPVGVCPNPAIIDRINALHPWFYPVNIDGMTVNPGLGSDCTSEWLSSQAAQRSTLLVQEVLKRVDFRGKSVLDLSCNCAFWSSHYALAGASKLLGIDGSSQHIAQAELYWERNSFLPKQQYEFMQGNIADESTWKEIRARGQVDIALCAEALSPTGNYAEVLARVAELTKEVIIIDTRVRGGCEETSAEARGEAVPGRDRLLQAIRQLGFEPEVMPVGFSPQLGVDGPDNDSGGSRITIIARKAAVPTTPSSPPSRTTASEGKPTREVPQHMLRSFRRDELAAVPSDWVVGPPDFVGIGCAKAGTSWWSSVLGAHPQVVENRLGLKELHHFPHSGWRAPDAETLDIYRNAFARPPGKMCGEWSSNYLYYPFALESLAEAAPQAKLIAVVRNPVDLFISALNQYYSVRAELVGATGPGRTTLETWSLFPESAYQCRIAENVRRTIELFGRDRLLVLQYEACVQDPAREYRRTLEFLGLDTSFVPSNMRQPVNKRQYKVERPEPWERQRIAKWFESDVRALLDLDLGLEQGLWKDFSELVIPSTPGAIAPRTPVHAGWAGKVPQL